MLKWLGLGKGFAFWMLISSAVMFGGALLLVPILVARIPEDYFVGAARTPSPLQRVHPALRWMVFILKNLLGLACLFFGALMLVLPGQGILTLLLGISLLDFPGKYRMQKWLIGRKGVLESVNWMRRRRGAPPLRVEG